MRQSTLIVHCCVDEWTISSSLWTASPDFAFSAHRAPSRYSQHHSASLSTFGFDLSGSPGRHPSTTTSFSFLYAYSFSKPLFSTLF